MIFSVIYFRHIWAFYNYINEINQCKEAAKEKTTLLFCAVKCNSDPALVTKLANLGANFVCASLLEIDT